ncbi:hypothetical protein [Streptomyces sp. AC550_RSS872]|uniref:hypothetical protein n=1 Tax=Streptomyces sp. AC550_RSS872 TaxID=2823689 RepID=UPI001C26D604|nr:hypothetical protein [Streptomyces sp. AC550_RSS872]
MRIRTRRMNIGLMSAAILLSSAGLGLTTASPASAACDVRSGIIGDVAWAKNVCSAKLYRKFVWGAAPDSPCYIFRPGHSHEVERPFRWATFEGMKSC